MNDNLLKQKWIWLCLFLKPATSDILEIISKSVLFAFFFWLAEQDTAFNAMVKIWDGVLVILYFKLDTDHAQCTANSRGAD